MPGPKSEIVEPGHQLEWAWILASASKLLKLDLADIAKSLVRVPEVHGLQATTQAVFNAITKDGSPLDDGSRTWPNTERLKAGVALYELFGQDTKPMINTTLDLMFDRYLLHTPRGGCPRGGWHDAFDRDGRPIATAMPTSTFYHIFLAFAEVRRVADGLNRL
ncbi:MAG: hypothetical protein HC777_00555 [Hyphomonadaceae bacterium]|nr:hypothetical protein [Hyphomonadaceae bacterium]